MDTSAGFLYSFCIHLFFLHIFIYFPFFGSTQETRTDEEDKQHEFLCD